MINHKRLLEEFFHLVKISSPSGNERQMADYLKSTLTALGLEVMEDTAGQFSGGNAGNVIGYLKGRCPKIPRLLLSAHMDCVDPCHDVKPTLNSGIIRSDGSTVLGGDDKAGIAPILEALRILSEQNLPHGDLSIVFTIGEEAGLHGSKHIEVSHLRADLGFCLDSSGRPGKLIIAAPGQNDITAKIFGVSAHAGLAPEAGVNAIIAAARAITSMPSGRLDEETTANIGIIRGGSATNIVPAFVEVFAEARSHDLKKLAHQTETMKSAFEITAQEYGARAEVTVINAYPSYKLSKNSLLLQIGQAALQKSGLTAEFAASGGGSDANYLNAKGLPCAVLSVGMTKVHTTEEYLLEKDLYKTAQIALNLILETARHS